MEKALLVMSGALVSALVNAIFNYVMKVRELRIRDIELATRLVEIRFSQVSSAKEWALRENQKVAVTLHDPAMQMIDYLQAIDEIRRKGTWKKGEQRQSG